MKYSPTLTKIAPAVLAAQKSIGSAKKDAVNPFFKSSYADLGSVMEACKEAFNDNGITVLQPVGTNEEGQVYVETVLLHESGEWISDQMLLSQKITNDPQSQGSAISYARRYSLQSIAFIPAEDDDAEKTKSPVKSVSPNQNSEESEPVGNPSGNLISPAQLRLVAVLLNKKGKTDEQLKTKYKVESKKDLTKQQASEIIEYLNTLPDTIDDVPERQVDDYE